MHINQIKICAILFMTALCFFISSCGLAVYYVLEPPEAGDSPTSLSTDYGNKYFNFDTADHDNLDTEGYKGTQVYYKIYNSLTKLSSQVSSINAVNDEYSEAGYNKMDITFDYKALQFVDSDLYDLTSSIYIQNNDNSNQDVQIRLITEGSVVNSSDYFYYTGVYIDQGTESQSTDGQARATVFRTGGVAFTLSDVSDDIETAVSSDGTTGNQGDMYINSKSDEYWYVAAYAVSYGMDSNFSPFYSELEYLGYLTFEYDDE